MPTDMDAGKPIGDEEILDWIKHAPISSVLWLLYLRAVLTVRDTAAPIIHRVSQAESGSTEEMFAAFSEALEELPPLLEHLKTAPRLLRLAKVDRRGFNPRKLRAIHKLEVKGLEAYIKSCKWGAKLLKDPSSSNYSRMMFQVSLATEYWDISAKAIAVYIREVIKPDVLQQSIADSLRGT